jgi:diguanylate cyclase (GGDEF)-like protein/PAS domain S-box-containing protein
MEHQPDSAVLAATLVDRLPGAVALVGADRRYRYVNARFAALADMPPEALVGQPAAPGLTRALIEAGAGRQAVFRCDLNGHRLRGTIAPDDVSGGALLVATEDSGRIAAAAGDAAILDQAFDNAPIGMAVVDPEARMLRVNPAFAQMLTMTAEELVGRTFATITHPEDIGADLEQFGEVLAGRSNGYQMEKRYVRPDGGIVHVKMTVTVIRDRHGRATRFIGQLEDITEARATEIRIRAGAARLALAVEAINGGFWHMDVATQTFETSTRLSRFTAGEDAPMGLTRYVEHIHPDDLAAADLSPLIEGRVDALAAEYRLVGAAGERWVRCDRRLVRGADGAPEQIVGVVDLTAEREGRRLAEVEAETDGLTGLLNRRGAMRRIAALDRAQPCGVIAIDLDRFKEVNDRFGHQAGDEVLRACAGRLKQELRAGDVVARLGGDEFLIAMPGVTEATMAPVAERLGIALSRPLRRGDSVLPVGGSVGTAWAEAAPADFTALIAEADAALYRDKEARRERRRA